MRSVDGYVNDVLRNVFASAAERERFEADLRAHFEEGLARGETAAEVIHRMGPPEEVAAAFNAERPLRYAGFWVRLLAFAADVGFLVAVNLPLLALGVWLHERAPVDGTASPAAMAVLVVAGLTFTGTLLFYFPLAEGRFGKTLAKHLLALRVVRETGAAIGFGAAFLRRLSFYFEFLVLDALFVPFTEKRQRAFDIIAKTVVAREPGRSVPAWRYGLCLALAVLPWVCMGLVVALCQPR